MTARIYWTLILFFGITSLFAQEQTYTEAQEYNLRPEEQCAQHEIHERMMEENPQYRAEQEAREAELHELVRQYNRGMIPKNDEIFTIPVVVHVIHDGDAYGSGSNITDEQIYSAINGLNQDYRKMAGTNGDGAGADIGVEFCLAQRDPSGNATTGITRTNGCSVPLYCSEGITAGNGQGASETAVKNLSRWPNQEYYNIWVVTEIENNNGGSGIQAYAYFPTTSQVDGTVIIYNAFGTEGALKSYTNMNRSITHELGHAFALFHTFQGGSCSESNCAWQGDRVCDTPPTTLNDNCNDPACGGTQQIENYMDYTKQWCKDMFTEGQKTRMRLAIQNSRSNLINSNACEPVNAVSADAAITDISEPTGNTCTNMIQPIITLSNEGTINLNNTVIKYRTAGNWEAYHWTGLLGPGQFVDITLPVYDGGWGPQDLTIKTDSPNGAADANSGNDSQTISYNAVNNGHTLTFNLTKDVLGGQSTWELRNSANETLASGGPYANFEAGTVETEIFCVDDGCYDFILFDIGGNGICCESGEGSYELLDEEGNILASGASFGNQELTNFCLDAGGSPPSANFEAATTNLCAGGSTSFTNLTTGDVDSYNWKFFGGTPFTATGANPGTITYDTPGTYNVRLQATNAYGEDVEVKSDYITVSDTQTWYADTDNDGHGDPSSTVSSCTQPTGYVALGDDCNDSDGNDWDSCYDCLGVMNGTAVLDNCDVCDSNPNNDCEQDCLGEWGGDAVMDNCGVCDNNPSNDCEQDCLGEWGGDAVMDNCGVCDNNPNNDCEQDCLGEWGGDAEMDNCGVCDSNPNNDCQQDCAGEWGGTAYYDDCGTCDDDPSNDCEPCDEIQINLVEAVPPSCNGATDGQITIEVVNAIGEYSVEWSTGATTETIANLPAGNYSVTAQQEECTVFMEIVLGEPEELSIAIENIVFDDCSDQNTGMADIEVAGGTEPYIISVNDVLIDSPALSQLAQGAYAVSVSDAHNCSAEYAFQIGQINCDSLPSTQIIASICNGGVSGFFEEIACLPVAEAESYAWELRDIQNPETVIAFTTTQPGFTAESIPEIVPGNTYGVRVKAQSSELPGDFGPECELRFDFGTTQLIAGDCGNMELYMEDVIGCNAIEGSTDYEFRFEDVSTGERFYHYTQGALNCMLSEVETVKENTDYEVLVRGKYRNIWGNYGAACNMKIIPKVETTALTDEWCNNLYIDFDFDQILVQPIENATVYELRISDADGNQVAVQNTTVYFSANSISGINENQVYTAQARAYVNGSWSPWGTSCDIGFEDPEGLKLNLSIFPNPVAMDRHLSMQAKGDWEGVVVIVCDAYGHNLITVKRNFKNGIPQKMEISGLRPGLYFIYATHGKQSLAKKFIIE